jgi:peroxiredoxin
MKYFVLISFVLINFSFIIAQEIIIKAANSNGKTALFSLSGEKSSFIDSIPPNSNIYQFNLSNNNPGFYRLIFNNKKWLDFVYDRNDIEIEKVSDNTLEQTKIIQSDENKIYHDFINLNKDYKTKTDLLYLILSRYPADDDYIQFTKEKLINLQQKYLYFVNATTQSNPSSFIARYVNSSQMPVVSAEVTSEEQLAYLKTHALNNVNFNDDGLIYSDAFTNKAIEYLSYYRNPQMPMGLLEKEFETAVDTILNKARVNAVVYKHIVEYLLDGFKKYGFDNVINYILENYVIADDICLDEKLESALDRRLNQSKYFKTGAAVPDFSLSDLSGTIIRLNEITVENILIIFYASWCPHCIELLPKINNLYRSQTNKKFEVLAVSIDTAKTDWQNFVINNNLNWINVCDLKGWNGKAALDYYIYATPTMFLVDKNKKIIAKPTSIEDVKTFF